MKPRLFCSILIVLLTLCTATAQTDKKEATELRYKIGQLLVVGFKGHTLNEQSLKVISRYNVGGIILFDRDLSNAGKERNIIDPTQVKNLVSQMQGLSDKSLLICVDQEGGRVARLKESRGFYRAPSAAHVGKLDNLDSTAYYARRTAKQLKELGINVNFAPCVDLSINKQNPIIAGVERGYSDEPQMVIKHARATIDQYRKFNIATSIKHFPGHGSSQADSHLGLTDITETFQEKELEPYRVLIDEDRADMVMIGHLFNSRFDTLYPASLSEKTINGILREQLGYKGVVITDDMHMKAITDNYSYPKALELAINAGVDMIIIGNNAKEYVGNLTEQTVGIIWQLVESGVVSKERIEEAYQRVHELKTKMGLK